MSLHTYIYTHYIIYILGCVKIQIWTDPQLSGGMDRSGSPAFCYGSGVWIGLWVRVSMGLYMFWLAAIYIHLDTFRYIISISPKMSLNVPRCPKSVFHARWHLSSTAPAWWLRLHQAAATSCRLHLAKAWNRWASGGKIRRRPGRFP